VAIGRALVRDAGVFLFDEPLSNLDAQLRAELRVEIKHLHHRLGATMIYVTHDQIEALTLADRIAVMRERRIQQLGTPQDVYQRPANRFVATFVGSPAMSFVKGRLAEGGLFEAEGLRVDVSGYGFASHPVPGQPAELGIRPEHVARSETGHASTIDMVEPMGADLLAWTTLGGSPVSIRLAAETRIAVGDPIRVELPARHLSLFDLATGSRL
jgi:multiple sugar transport system ATP-binding protein